MSQETDAKLLSMMFDTSTKVLGRLFHYVDQNRRVRHVTLIKVLFEWITQQFKKTFPAQGKTSYLTF